MFKDCWIEAPSISKRREETVSNSTYRGNENAGRCIQGGGSKQSVCRSVTLLLLLLLACYRLSRGNGTRQPSLETSAESEFRARERDRLTFKRKETIATLHLNRLPFSNQQLPLDPSNLIKLKLFNESTYKSFIILMF